MNNDFLHFLFKQFNLGQTISLAPITKGYSSQNFQITTADGNKYFLKKYDHEIKDFDFIEHAESFFLQGGFPVIQPLISKTGSKYVKYRSHVYSVYPFIDAQFVPSKHLTDQHAFNLGCFLAKMHKYSEDNQNSYSYYVKKLKPHKLVDKNNILRIYYHVLRLLEKKSNRDELDDKVYLLLRQKVERIKNHKPHKLDLEDEKIILLHGDFNNENVFFDVSTNIINVFDFDRVFVGYALYELISSLIIIFFDNFEEKNFDKASKFLSGYKSIKHINQQFFKRTIQYFINELFYTSLFEEEKYLRKSDRFDNIYKHYLSTLKYFLQKNDFTERISNYS